MTTETLFYSVDEYGVREYKQRWIFGVAFATLALCIAVSASLVFYFESGQQEANINNYGDAVWLMMMASSTIGFGEVYPVTWAGRIVTWSMFFIGGAFVGVIIAAVANFFTSFSDTAVKNRELRQQNETILTEVKELRNMIMVFSMSNSSSAPANQKETIGD